MMVDAAGNLIELKQMNENDDVILDISNQPNGLYFLTDTNINGAILFSAKIIK